MTSSFGFIITEDVFVIRILCLINQIAMGKELYKNDQGEKGGQPKGEGIVIFSFC